MNQTIAAKEEKDEYQKSIDRYKYNKKIEAYNGFNYDTQMEHRKETDVGSGSWIIIIKTIPVSETARPVLYGIYWGVPNRDKFGRQTCKIRTTEDVTLLNYEFTIVDDECLEKYREFGWELDRVQNTSEIHEAVNLELIERGRSLAEEEREMIWALQLDGLSETQACEEYFFSRHVNTDNYTICYLPNDEVKQQIYAVYGSNR